MERRHKDLNIALAFAPFAIFAILARMASPTTALIAAAAVSILILLRDWLLLHKSRKILEIGSALLFGGLGIYGAVVGARWPVLAVRLYVDSGLLLIVLVSLVVRRPFTLQYAREEVSPQIWNQLAFIRTNYVISAAWAAAFAVMVAADVAMLYLTKIPLAFGVGVTVLALFGAIRFTSNYPVHVQRTAGQTANAKSQIHSVDEE